MSLTFVAPAKPAACPLPTCPPNREMILEALKRIFPQDAMPPNTNLLACVAVGSFYHELLKGVPDIKGIHVLLPKSPTANSVVDIGVSWLNAQYRKEASLQSQD